MDSWHFLQLADSAFPAGGFAHSGGIEAALQQGEIRGAGELEGFLREALWQAGFGALPLANEAHERPAAWAEADSLCDVFLSNPVANRASRVQGRAFLATCRRSLGEAALEPLGRELRTGQQHLAPLFGRVLRQLGCERAEMQRLYLHLALRGLVSASVRLGIVGPYQAQGIQWRLAPLLEEVLARCARLGREDLAQTAPLLDLFQTQHDRLYSRLFQS